MAWAPLVDDYLLTLAAAGQPPATLALRRVQLVRMARDLGGDPAEVIVKISLSDRHTLPAEAGYDLPS